MDDQNQLSPKTKNKLFRRIGYVLIALSAVVYFTIPFLFSNVLCDTSKPDNKCEDVALGIVGYMAYVTVPLFIGGLALVIVSYLAKKN